MSEFLDRAWMSPDGLRLHARDYPAAAVAGPARLPVICLHGLTRNARDFEAVAPWIAGRGRRVLALDIRGRGGSADAPDPMTYSPPVYAGDVIALMGDLGLARAVFVGTSMGGLVTLALAALAPPLVAAALLNDVGPEVSTAGLARITAYAGGDGQRTFDWAEAVAYAEQTNAAAFPAYGPTDWEAFARRLFRPQDGGYVLDYDPRIMVPIVAAAAAGAPAPDLWPLFAALAADRPLALVRGARSDVLEPATVARMREAAPHMTVAEVAGVGHAPMLTEPEARAALATLLDAAP